MDVQIYSTWLEQKAEKFLLPKLLFHDLGKISNSLKERLFLNVKKVDSKVCRYISKLFNMFLNPNYFSQPEL